MAGSDDEVQKSELNRGIEKIIRYGDETLTGLAGVRATNDADPADREDFRRFTAQVYVEPQGLAWRSRTEERLHDHCVDFLCHDSQRVFVLLGDPGAGKTCFIERFFNRCLRAFKEGKAVPLPLLMKLNEVFRDSAIRTDYLMEDYLREKVGLTVPELNAVKAHQPLVIFCDGFDEISFDKNLYQENRWGEHWATLKCLISSRPEKFGTALSEEDLQNAFRKAFSPVAVGPGPTLPKGLRVCQLSPFSPAQVTSFIEQWQPLQPHAEDWPAERYQSSLADIPGLQELTTNPVILSLVLYALPNIVRARDNESDELNRKQLQRIDVYDEFVNAWFRNQSSRLEQKLKKEMPALPERLQTLYEALYEGDEERAEHHYFVEPLKSYTTQLAYWTVLNQQSGKLKLEIPEYITLQPYLLDDPTRVGQTISLALNEKEREALCRALRSGCLLNCEGGDDEVSMEEGQLPKGKKMTRYFRFFHKSLVEYFAQAYIFKGVAGLLQMAVEEQQQHQNQNIIILEQNRGTDVLNHRLTDVNLLRMLAERVKQENAKNIQLPFKQHLKDIIQESRYNPAVACAAANAITILNYAEEPLNLLSLQGVRIPGADLSGAILHRANLQGADVSGVCFRGAYLVEATLERALAKGCEWGQPDEPLQFDCAVTALVYTPDGQWLIVGDWSSKIYFVHRQSFQVEAIVKHYSIFATRGDVVSALAVNGNKITAPSRLASGNQDGKIYLWQLPQRKCAKKLSDKGMQGTIHALVFHPAGVILASASEDGVIRLWDTNKKTFLKKLEGHSKGVSCLAYSPQGEQLASGSWDKTVRLWQHSDNSVRVLEGHTGSVFCVAYSPQGEQLASGGNKTVRLWQLSDNSVRVLEGHTNDVRCLTYSPQGDQLASGGDKTVRLWQLSDNSVRVLEGHTDGVDCAAYSPQGEQFASGSRDKTVLWQLSDHSVRVLHTSKVTCVAYSPQGTQLASGSHNKTVCLRQLSDHSVRVLGRHTDRVTCVAYSPQGTQLASGSKDKTVRLWQLSDNSVRVLEGHTGIVRCIAYSPQGDQLASGSDDKTVRLWQLSDHSVRVLARHTQNLTCFAYSPQGDQLASGSGYPDCKVYLWHLADGTARRVLDGHTSFVRCIAYSPQGEQLASGSEDRTVRLWNTRTGVCLKVMEIGFYVLNLFWQGSFLKIMGCYDVKNLQCLIFEFTDNGPRLCQWLEKKAPPFTTRLLDKINLTHVKGLSLPLYRFLQSQGAIGKPRAFLPSVLNPPEAEEDNKQLLQVIAIQKALRQPPPPGSQLQGQSVLGSKNPISYHQWQVYLLRVTQPEHSGRSGFSSSNRHAYGLLEGLDQTGRRVFIRFDFVNEGGLGRLSFEGIGFIKFKSSFVDNSLTQDSGRAAFLALFKKDDRGLPTQLVCHHAGHLSPEQVSTLLTNIMNEQALQASSEKAESRLRYQFFGGSGENNRGYNCLTWLLHILCEFKELKLPRGVMDRLYADPQSVLPVASSLFSAPPPRLKIINCRDWVPQANEANTIIIREQKGGSSF